MSVNRARRSGSRSSCQAWLRAQPRLAVRTAPLEFGVQSATPLRMGGAVVGGARWGAVAVLVLLAGGCSRGAVTASGLAAPTVGAAAPSASPSGSGSWYCLAESVVGYGVCLADPLSCETARQEAGSADPCTTQPFAWCFLRPRAASKSRLVACTPTGNDCGYARALFIERNERPPRQCRRYDAPTASGSKALAAVPSSSGYAAVMAGLDERCQAGDGKACFVAAIHAEQGEATRRDVKLCASLSERACGLGVQAGCTLLGRLYLGGEGVPRDPRKAFEIFQRECAADFARGCESLGEAYERGWGTKPNFQKALEAYRKSCRLDPDNGCDALRRTYTDD